MLVLDIKIHGIEELERLVNRVPLAAAAEMHQLVMTAAKAGIDYTKQHHRYGDRTGKLTETSHAVLIETSSRGTTAEMVWPQKYASYVDKGTKAHEIRGNPWLRFEWNGERVKFDVVNHPGIRQGRTFADDAARVAQMRLDTDVKAALDRIAGLFNG